MVRAEPDTSTTELTIGELGKAYAEATRAWSEAFLFFYNQPGRNNKPRTVAEAQAMAHVDVNLVGAETAYRGALNATQSHS